MKNKKKLKFCKNQLAIVIPAYKERYLERTLKSLAAQTCKKFSVYVGDDCSPGNLQKICNKFSQKINLKYVRFAENLGQVSLVGQWERCIALSNEPWIWLFSDDDLMDSQCVEEFHEKLKSTSANFDLYRFNTLRIDTEDRILKIHPPHPLEESSLEFAYHRFSGGRKSFATEYIFSREVYMENGGMVKFPIGWCSDDASWILFATRTGIYTIKGPFVRWRQSGENITTHNSKYQSQKIIAAGAFIDWFYQWFKKVNPLPQPFSLDLFRLSQRRWFMNQLRLVAPYSFRALLKGVPLPRHVEIRSQVRKHMLISNLYFYIKIFISKILFICGG